MTPIPVRYWLMTFNKWYKLCRALMSGVRVKPDSIWYSSSYGSCGYCRHMKKMKYTCFECSLSKLIGRCNSWDSIFRQILSRFYGKIYDFDTLALARQIFLAIVKEGREYGYIGDREESMIVEILNGKGEG